MENPFKWDDKTLSIGVHSMDEEHQILIDLMNRLFEQSNSGKSKTEIIGTLGDLGHWVVKHFSNEEAYMASINYPKLEIHRVIHKGLIDDFTKFAHEYEAGFDRNVSDDFLQFLKVWLWTHIQGIDRQYGTYASHLTSAA